MPKGSMYWYGIVYTSALKGLLYPYFRAYVSTIRLHGHFGMSHMHRGRFGAVYRVGLGLGYSALVGRGYV